MSLPASSPFQFTADLGICRILNGMWQVSIAMDFHRRAFCSATIATLTAACGLSTGG
jgi:hypothetical protein